jgi:sterol desaturase/sphingolipid hydroxylase (fatty acid hydroxylase superfamily)
MSLKWTIIVSVLWVILMMAISLGMLWYLWENRVIPRSQFEARASQLGRGVGIFTAISLAPLWLYWAVKHRKAHAKNA